MPELPEVETYGRYFARHALNQRIARVNVLDERILGEIRADAFARKLKGVTFTHVRRHGKHLFVDAGRTWLRLHFGMTGDLAYYSSHQVLESSSRREAPRRLDSSTTRRLDAPPRFARVV